MEENKMLYNGENISELFKEDYTFICNTNEEAFEINTHY